MPRYNNWTTSSRLIVYEAKRHFCNKIMNNAFFWNDKVPRYVIGRLAVVWSYIKQNVISAAKSEQWYFHRLNWDTASIFNTINDKSSFLETIKCHGIIIGRLAVVSSYMKQNVISATKSWTMRFFEMIKCHGMSLDD